MCWGLQDIIMPATKQNAIDGNLAGWGFDGTGTVEVQVIHTVK
jgi:hypothetical protein